MYSTHNEGKFVVAERFVRTLKTKICPYITSISENVYIDKLDDTVNKYNSTYHRTIKMKPILVQDNILALETHILTLLKKLMMKILSFKFVIMLKYQNIKKKC